MYQQYFGLTEPPFSIAPDPRYLFLSDKHREALAHLIYGVGDQGGFVVLTGEVGTGKTTICRCLLQQVPDNADIAFIINPKQSINQLLQSIFKDLSISYQPGVTSKELIDILNDYLLDAHARGRNTILIIDEAQNLSADVLEQLRLLTNLETNEKKLLQLVLLGQPELNDLLARPQLRQLAQRVTARYHLSPLLKSEVTEYIDHRLSVAGCRSGIFSPAAIRKIYQLSKGVPRLINLICDRSLLGVYATNSDQATPAIVVKAASEIFPDSNKSKLWQPVWALVVVLLVLAIAFIGLRYEFQLSPEPIATPAAVAPAVAPQSRPDWQQAAAVQSGPDLALEQMYGLWQNSAEVSQIEDCLDEQHQNFSVYCLTSLNTLAIIRLHNRPAVVEVSLDADLKGYLLIKSITGGDALVAIGDREYRIDTEQLLSLSPLNSYVLSRVPATIHLPIRPGDSGSEIAWLQGLIASYGRRAGSPFEQGRPVVDIDAPQQPSKYSFLYSHYLSFEQQSLTATYDLELQARVQQLQRELGLANSPVVDLGFVSALQQQLNQADPQLVATQAEQGS